MVGDIHDLGQDRDGLEKNPLDSLLQGDLGETTALATTEETQIGNRAVDGDQLGATPVGRDRRVHLLFDDLLHLIDEWGPEKIVCVSDARTGMRGVLVIDNTARGVGKGGTRMQPDVTVDEVARLAPLTWDQKMTHDAPWDIETLSARLPTELGPTLTPRPVPWPERPA